MGLRLLFLVLTFIKGVKQKEAERREYVELGKWTEEGNVRNSMNIFRYLKKVSISELTHIGPKELI